MPWPRHRPWLRRRWKRGRSQSPRRRSIRPAPCSRGRLGKPGRPRCPRLRESLRPGRIRRSSGPPRRDLIATREPASCRPASANGPPRLRAGAHRNTASATTRGRGGCGAPRHITGVPSRAVLLGKTASWGAAGARAPSRNRVHAGHLPPRAAWNVRSPSSHARRSARLWWVRCAAPYYWCPVPSSPAW